MITLRILLSPGRRGRVVDASGRSIPQPVPAPVVGSSEPLRIILLDPSTLDPADPYGFDTGAPLRLTISGDWNPETIPVYATNDLVRTSAGVYDLADPSGTRTAEALALLGVLAERLCAWELVAYGGNPETEADWAHPLSVVQFDAPLRQRADSLGGDPAEAPSVDLRGPAGAAATVTVGETTTLPAGSSATVQNVGTERAAILNFGIPGSGGICAVVWPPTGGGEKQVSPDALHDITFQTPLEVTATMTLVDIPQTGVHYWYFVLRNPSAYNVNLVWRPAASVDAGNNNSAFPAQITQKSVVYLLAASRNGLVVPLFAREVFSFYS